MVSVALALTVSLFLGTADFIGGQQTKKRSALSVLAISQLVGLIALLPVLAVLHPAPSDWSYMAWAALAGASVLLGATSLYRGLATGKMSVVAPISASAAIIPIAAGVLNGERPTVGTDAGIAVALLGVVVVTRSQSGENGDGEGRIARGVGFALLAALGGGVFLTAMDAASEGGILWAASTARVSLLCLLLALGVTVAPQVLSSKPSPPLAAIGILEVSSWVMFAAASTMGLLAVVGLLASLYPVVTVLLARFLLREQINQIQMAGIAMVMIGLGLIALM